MLSISASRYFPPRWIEHEKSGVQWVALNVDAHDRIYAKQFNFTIPVVDEDAYGECVEDRMTFVYNGGSIAPAPRTLRRYGADSTNQVVKVLRGFQMEKKSSYQCAQELVALFIKLDNPITVGASWSHDFGEKA